MKEPKQVVITLGTGDADGNVLNWLGDGKIPPELQEHLRDHKVQLHLRHIHPGVMIEKGSSPEDIQRLLEKALQGGADGPDAEKVETKPADDSSSDRVASQLEELTKQLQVLSERLSRLEEKK
jgi:DNA-binding transcriptional MerR regulator